MRVIVSAGGTGGHIYPALTVIDKIIENDPSSEILYIGTTNRMEKDLVPKRNIPYVGIEITGISRKNMFKNIKTLFQFIKSKKKLKKVIKEFNPDLVLGFGGYVTGPVIQAAKKLGYKTFIHEQNYIPGLSNKFLTKYADLIGVTFKESAQYFPSNKVIFTGHPRTEEAIKAKKITKKELGFDEKKPLVLIVMGSLGSLIINNKLKEMISHFKQEKFSVLVITGKDYYPMFEKINIPENVKIIPYHDQLLEVLTAVDLVVSRASAATILETYANNIPNILVPSPHVTDNHQYKNAQSLVDKGCALMLEETDFNSKNLNTKITELFNNKNEYQKLVKNIEANNLINSASFIYQLLLELKDK